MDRGKNHARSGGGADVKPHGMPVEVNLPVKSRGSGACCVKEKVLTLAKFPTREVSHHGSPVRLSSG
jgi:hypothetical protein